MKDQTTQQGNAQLGVELPVTQNPLLTLRKGRAWRNQMQKATREQLIEVCQGTLRQIDDWQQQASDLNLPVLVEEYQKHYHTIEKILYALKNGKNLRTMARWSIVNKIQNVPYIEGTKAISCHRNSRYLWVKDFAVNN